MNTYDLAYQILANGFLPSSHPEYPLAPSSAIPYQLYRELNDCMTQNFERMVVNARSGYWLKSRIVTTVAGTATYRLPPRMCTGGLERVEIAQTATSAYEPLQQESGTEAVHWELPNSGRGKPARYELRGDAIALLPAPDSSSYQLRLWYYIRPSMLVTPQGSSSGELSNLVGSLGAPGFTPTQRGVIGAINTTTRVVTVNVLPNDMLGSVAGLSIVNGSTVDIVRGYGWYETVATDLAVSGLSGTTFTLGGTDSLDDVSADPAATPHYVRVTNQTDWPPIPRDFHRTLADVATISVLTQLHLLEKAAAYAEKVSADLERFRELLQPRVKNQAGGLIPMMMPGMQGRGPAFRGGFP